LQPRTGIWVYEAGWCGSEGLVNDHQGYRGRNDRCTHVWNQQRDHQLKRSLTQVVQFHKHFRNEDESTKAKVQSEYGLHELMLQEI
jgi:hypothetical protein